MDSNVFITFQYMLLYLFIQKTMKEPGKKITLNFNVWICVWSLLSYIRPFLSFLSKCLL